MPIFHGLTGHVANNVYFTGVRYESPGSEVVPDSEEERQRDGAKSGTKIIVISSDESGNEGCTSITMSPTKPSVTLPESSKRPNPRKYTGRRIILSSDDDSEVEIVEATSENITEKVRVTDTALKGKAVFRDAEDSFQATDSDDAIIMFDEPKRAKPLKKGANDILPRNVKKAVFEERETPSRSSATLVAGPSTLVSTPVSRRVRGKLATPNSRSEKARLIEKHEMLRAYAKELFGDLNKTVFNGALPASTKLNWNKRLLKTAGRAKFHRSRDGVQTVEIELAPKILDCEDRIRNTLSHEMCHLATWIIDKKIDEHHGKLFRKWANLVMQTHPEIYVSVRHDYEISYPFEWKCEKCAKIYGRFSKSIRPDECVCGVCKEGTLIPLFDSKRPKYTSKSKFAAGTLQESPLTKPTRSLERTDTEPEDSDIEILARTLASTSITL